MPENYRLTINNDNSVQVDLNTTTYGVSVSRVGAQGPSGHTRLFTNNESGAVSAPELVASVDSDFYICTANNEWVDIRTIVGNTPAEHATLTSQPTGFEVVDSDGATRVATYVVTLNSGFTYDSEADISFSEGGVLLTQPNEVGTFTATITVDSERTIATAVTVFANRDNRRYDDRPTHNLPVYRPYFTRVGLTAPTLNDYTTTMTNRGRVTNNTRWTQTISSPNANNNLYILLPNSFGTPLFQDQFYFQFTSAALGPNYTLYTIPDWSGSSVNITIEEA